jgi:hypothetical protein
LGNLAGGLVAPVKAVFMPPEDATEHAITSVGGPSGLIAYRTSKAVVDAVDNMVKSKKEGFKQAAIDLAHAINEFHNKDYRSALADFASVTAGTMGLTDPAMEQGRFRELAQGVKKGGDLATPLTKDVVDVGAAAALERIGGKLTGEAEVPKTVTDRLRSYRVEGEEAATTPKPASPSTIKGILKGEKVAQAPAEEALRSGAQAVGGKGANSSLRSVLEEPIDNVEHSSRAAYRQVDKAAGTDFKALNEKLENTEYNLRQLTETEEDVAKEAALEKSRVAIMDKIEAAKQQAIQAGVDPKLLEQADAQFKQASALKDLQTKVFKNTNVISGNQAMGAEESINVNSAVKELQKLQDNTKFGTSRLEQALGKEGAEGLLRDMYAAQKAGIKAIKNREMLAKFAKWAAYGGGALAGGKMIFHSVLGE